MAPPGGKSTTNKLICQVCSAVSDKLLMVKCDSCQKWSHFECVGVNESSTEKNTKWICDECESDTNTSSTIIQAVVSNTQPPVTNKPNNKDICSVCLDDKNYLPMVCCTKCKQWCHFACVGVNETVKSRKWLCPACEETKANDTMVNGGGNTKLPSVTPAGKPRSKSKGALSTTSSQRIKIAFELERLQEEHEMMEKMKTEEAKAKQERFREYMEKKYAAKIKLAELSSEDSTDGDDAVEN